MTVDSAIVLRVVPYGIDNWNVIRVHDSRKQTLAGHIERHKGLVARFHAFDEHGRLLKKDYSLTGATDTIRKRQHRNLGRQQQ